MIDQGHRADDIIFNSKKAQFANMVAQQAGPESFNNTIRSVDDTQFNKFLSKIDTVLDKCERLEGMIKHSPRILTALGSRKGSLKNDSVKFEGDHNIIEIHQVGKETVKKGGQEGASKNMQGFSVQDVESNGRKRFNSREHAKE